jgi:hypothetical protein
MESIVDILGYGGMSSDETETEATRTTVKVVRRREKPWRDPSLSRILEAVDQYDRRIRREKRQTKGGNPGFDRLPCLETKPNSTTPPVCGLPKNFYRPTWWLSQHSHVQDNLLSKPEQTLPDYTQYVLFLCQSP